MDAVKAAFKSKSITLEEDDGGFELTADMKAVLDERLQEDESTYLTAEESINQLKKTYDQSVFRPLAYQRPLHIF